MLHNYVSTFGGLSLKKILLAAAIFAAASFNSFGAACMATGTIMQFTTAGACTIGASNQWQLSNFLIFDSLASGFGANLGANDLVLTLANVGTNGFSTTYTIAQGSPNFMNVSPAGSGQTATWANGIWITGLAGNTSDDIVNVTNDMIGANGGAQVTLSKVIQDQTGAGLAVPTTFYNANNGTDTSETANIGALHDKLSVNDRIALDGRGAGTAGGITSYRNTYMAADAPSGVPEPMSLVLMGAGLVGIAALRRRKR